MNVELDAESYVYPRHLLDGLDSVLLLFCSGRMGAADGHWVAEAGIGDVTCVDWDARTLDPFKSAYPPHWTYLLQDAWDFAESADRQWDLVSVDAPSQYADLLENDLPMWCSLAGRYLTVTLMGDVPKPPIPAGWKELDVAWRTYYRGRDFNWLVLARDGGS